MRHVGLEEWGMQTAVRTFHIGIEQGGMEAYEPSFPAHPCYPRSLSIRALAFPSGENLIYCLLTCLGLCSC